MKKHLLFCCVLCVCFCSCNLTAGKADEKSVSGERKISLACWNTQTFFDAEIDGTEYDDYRDFSKWSKEKYLKRLSRLCEVMTKLNTDIFVLEEIENAAVVQDIANQLAGKAWNQKNNWNYACFSKEEDSAIGCAVFSKYSIGGMKVHNLDIRTQRDSQPAGRPIMEVSIDVDGVEIIVFVNHWKSKSGGEDVTEIWRDWQETVCAGLMNNLGKSNEAAIVFCGDFNRDIDDFCSIEKNDNSSENVLLRGLNGNVSVFSPWLNISGGYSTDVGSYFYDGNWERIDHIFTAGKLQLSAFSPRVEEPWCFSDSKPNAYKLYNGEGYSDHIPLMCILVF